MSDNLVLELLRAIRLDIGELREDVRDIKRRLTTLEIQVGNFAATEQSHHANIMLRLDHHDDRFGRVERRLELVDTH